MTGHEGTKARSAAHFARVFVLTWLIGGAAAPSLAQTRLAVLQAEDHRAATAAELALIRSGSHSSDPQIARVAVRALGRLERPALVADILPLLKHAAPEVRAEAANAVGQAAQGWKREKPPNGALDAAAAALTARLKIEGDSDVRAALAETIGRLPYAAADQAEGAEQALVDFDARAESVTDRLGVAKGLEALVRITRKVRGPGPGAVTVLRRLAIPGGVDATSGARIRRLALEALQSAAALDDDVVTKAMRDPDAQVRRIVMRAAPVSVLLTAVHDSSAGVRLEALRQLKAKGAEDTCEASLAAVSDRETAVALVALDQLSGCAGSAAAVAALDHAVTDLSEAGSPRGWHRAAHALVALAVASPERGAAVLGQFTGSRVWQLRMYAARAAATLHDREALEKLASDEDDNVREAAIDALATLFAHDADKIFVAQLTRRGHQVLRAAAAALSGTPDREAAIPALKTTLDRLVAEGSDNSHDARDAIIKTLSGLGAPAGAKTVRRLKAADTELDADDLRRLAAPRARVAVRGVGTFELALFTDQAPATVLRFAKLAESGYYNGLTFHRVVPNFVVQGGSPGANEYIGEDRFMRDELGLWPHVRGAVGISTRGRDTGDAQIFIDLVDNPRLDHEYTVFAQILNGIDVVDRILEGDVIERIEIVEIVL